MGLTCHLTHSIINQTQRPGLGGTQQPWQRFAWLSPVPEAPAPQGEALLGTLQCSELADPANLLMYKN